jgi:hypothetical protein
VVWDKNLDLKKQGRAFLMLSFAFFAFFTLVDLIEVNEIKAAKVRGRSR